jgi:hypothetical protein
MAMGYKTGGRQKGTPNKNRAALIERLSERFANYDPVIALAELAQDASVDLSVRLDCHKTLANYLYPKMRSVEWIDQNTTQPIVIQVVEPK